MREMTAEAVYELNQWCSGEDARPAECQATAQRLAELWHQWRRVTRFGTDEAAREAVEIEIAWAEHDRAEASQNYADIVAASKMYRKAAKVQQPVGGLIAA
jgi:hypothetical protein